MCGHVEVEEELPIDPTRSEIMEIDAKIIGAKMLKSKKKKKKCDLRASQQISLSCGWAMSVSRDGPILEANRVIRSISTSKIRFIVSRYKLTGD